MKKVKKVCAILLAALCIELFYFHFDYFYARFFSDVPHNVLLELNDFQTEHWQTTESGLVSEADPILVHSDADVFVEKLLIQAELDKNIPYVVLFYTDKLHKEFSEETMIVMPQPVNGAVEVPVSQHVKDIRIDLGDDAGVKLTGLSVTINPLYFNFSIARYVAMLTVCFGFWALTSLQRSPEYDLSKGKPGTGKVGETDE